MIHNEVGFRHDPQKGFVKNDPLDKLKDTSQIFCDDCKKEITDLSFFVIYINEYEKERCIVGTGSDFFQEKESKKLELCFDCINKRNLIKIARETRKPRHKYNQ